MPSYIRIEAVGCWLAAVTDQEDADFASEQAEALRGEDWHTTTTLGEELAALTRDVPGLFVAVRYRTEWKTREVVAYEDGRVRTGVIRPEDAPAADRRRGARAIAPSYAALLEAEAEAKRAIEADDVSAMLALLDDPRLGAAALEDVRRRALRVTHLVATRRALWRAVVARPRRPERLPFARVLRAFGGEPEEVAEAIAYKLFLQEHLRSVLLAPRAPESERVEGWLARAVEEWPDFPRPERPPAPPVVRRTLADRIAAVAGHLGDAEESELAAIARALSLASEGDRAEARAVASAALTALLAPEHARLVRLRAGELLFAIGAPRENLAARIADLAPSPLCDAVAAALRLAETPRETSSAPAAATPRRRAASVWCDASGIEDPVLAATFVAECRALVGRPEAFVRLAAIAEAFPRGALACLEDDGTRYVGRRGKLDWETATPTAAEIREGDVTKAPPAGAPLDGWAAFDAARTQLEAGAKGEEAFRLLLSPVLNEKRPPLRRLAEAARVEAYEALAAAPAPLPGALVVEALLADEAQGFRLENALQRRDDLGPTFGPVLAEASSPRVREAARRVLGRLASRWEPKATPAAVAVDLPIHEAIEAALAHAKESTLGAPSPKRRTAAEKAAFEEALALAAEAERTADVAVILGALEHPALASERANATRASLWRVVVRVKRRTLPFARVLRALAEETNEVVRAIGYKLYVQDHFAGLVLDAARDCFAREPRPARLLDCLAYCAQEWPDFPIPADVPADLARLLRPR